MHSEPLLEKMHTGTDYNQDSHSGFYDPPHAHGGSGISAYDSGVHSGDVDEDRLALILGREQKALTLQRELDEREEKLVATANLKGLKLPKNWPPYFLLARNAIRRDIPEEFQWEVRKFYSLWILTAIGAVFNFLIGFWYGVSEESDDDDEMGVTQWFLILGHLFIGVPTAWLLWYKKFYNAMRKGTNVPVLFFASLMAHIVWASIMAVGLVFTGSFGILFMGKMYTNKNDSLGTMAVLNAAIWTLNAIIATVLLKVGHRALGRHYAQEYIADRDKKAAAQTAAVADIDTADVYESYGDGSTYP